MNRPDLFVAVRDLLADLYPDKTSARRIVFEAGLDRGRIAFHARSTDTWQNILIYATQTREVDALFDVACGYFPKRADLAAVCAAYQETLAQGSGSWADGIENDGWQPGSKPPPLLRRIPAPNLIGRQREVDEVTALFHSGVRIVTLVGPGGVGKTLACPGNCQSGADRLL